MLTKLSYFPTFFSIPHPSFHNLSYTLSYSMQSKSIIWKNNTIIPPKLFECVSENVYRSNLVTEENILFLQTIQLKMVILLGDAHLDDTVSAYFHSFEIQIVNIQFLLYSRFGYLIPLTITIGSPYKMTQ